MNNLNLQGSNLFSSDNKPQPSRRWNMSVQNYRTSGPIIVEPTCFAFMFTNLGDTIAFVEGIVIFPPTTPGAQRGDAVSIAAHVLDIYKGNITLAFDTAAGTAPNVELIQLFYAESYHR